MKGTSMRRSPGRGNFLIYISIQSIQTTKKNIKMHYMKIKKRDERKKRKGEIISNKTSNNRTVDGE